MTAMAGTGAAPLLSVRFARAYATTMRPYLLFVSGITGLVGLSLGPRLAWFDVALIGAVCFCSYGFGQALTDCFQLDTDALSSPYRPLVQGAVRRDHVLAVSLTGLAVSGAIVTWYNPWNLVPAALTVIGLATYTPLKRRWWGGPPYNAGIVLLLGVIAFAAAAGVGHGSGAPLAVAASSAAAVFFGYANFVLAGYFKDVAADRVTGYRTFPVVFGRPAASIASDVLAAAAAAGAGGAVILTGAPPAAVGFLAIGVVASVTAQARLHRARADSDAHRAIAPTVHAYLLLLASVASARRPEWGLLLGCFCLGYLAVLERRPEPSQI
jgi:4-hydroxybenzoate polyprenyltransferase